MLQSLAATGYLVLSIDHPYDADFVEFPDGTVVTGVEIDSDAQIELSVKTRAADIVFVSEQMKNASAVEKMFAGRLHARSVPKMAVFGHSLGGAAAANAVMQVPSLRGGFNLDGSVFGPVVEAGLDRPFMLMGHENKTQETDPSWKAIWSQLKGWKKEFEVNGAAHYSFSDLPLVTSALGLEGHLPAEVGDILGTIKGIIMSQITNAYCAAFMDMVLKDGKKNGFLTAGKQFSEVKEVA
ncbi:PAF acetylhydrolase family protein [Pyrenophora tritici-repentis]|nr:PAF acetylhydrolase family protein [Pyrenophora tritici-repentis]